MSDRILDAFLRRQREEGLALAAESDLLTLTPLDGDPPRRYVAEFHCTGLVRTPAGAVVEADRFAVGIWFSDQYLRAADTFTTLTWLAPRSCWHPNVSNRGPFVCIGRLVPGMPLVQILYQLFEIITYAKVTMREDDALNAECCAWARANVSRFPIDRRALKRVTGDVSLDFDVVEVQP